MDDADDFLAGLERYNTQGATTLITAASQRQNSTQSSTQNQNSNTQQSQNQNNNNKENRSKNKKRSQSFSEEQQQQEEKEGGGKKRRRDRHDTERHGRQPSSSTPVAPTTSTSTSTSSSAAVAHVKIAPKPASNNNLPPLPAPKNWICGVCTFENDIVKDTKCSICDNEKGCRQCSKCFHITKKSSRSNCTKCSEKLIPSTLTTANSTSNSRASSQQQQQNQNQNENQIDRPQIQNNEEEDEDDEELLLAPHNDERGGEKRKKKHKKDKKDKKKKKKKKHHRSQDEEENDEEETLLLENQHQQQEEELPNQQQQQQHDEDEEEEEESDHDEESETDEDDEFEGILDDETSDSDYASSGSGSSSSNDDDEREEIELSSDSDEDDDNKVLEREARKLKARKQKEERRKQNKKMLVDDEDEIATLEREQQKKEEEAEAAREGEVRVGNDSVEDILNDSKTKKGTQEQLRRLMNDLVTQCAHDDIQPTHPPPTMRIRGQLRPFQLQALAWCLQREGAAGAGNNNNIQNNNNQQQQQQQQNFQNQNNNNNFGRNNNNNFGTFQNSSSSFGSFGSNQMNQHQQNQYQQQNQNPLHFGSYRHQQQQNTNFNNNNNNNNFNGPFFGNNNNNNNNFNRGNNNNTNLLFAQNQNQNQNQNMMMDLQQQQQQIQENQNLSFRGGIVADFMGFGKTRTMISVCETTRDLALRSNGNVVLGAKVCSSATLIVCPVSVMANWIHELKLVIDGPRPRKVLRYHGNGRHKNLRTVFNLAQNYDYVITTYHTIAYDLKHGGGNTPLARIEWFRVILDEAHIIRNRLSSLSRCCCSLLATRRWIVTATPFQNRVDDLYPLLKFLRVPCFSQLGFWRETVLQPLAIAVTKYASSVEAKTRALAPLQAVLGGIMLRRTFATLDPVTKQPIVVLPKRTDYSIVVHLSPDEKKVYDHVFNGAQVRLQELQRWNPGAANANANNNGNNENQNQNQNQNNNNFGFGRVENNPRRLRMTKQQLARSTFATAFEMLIRCRQACCHIFIMVRALQIKARLQAIERGEEIPACLLQQEFLNSNSNSEANSPTENSSSSASQNQNQNNNAFPNQQTVLAGQQQFTASIEEAARIAAEEMEKKTVAFMQNIRQRIEKQYLDNIPGNNNNNNGKKKRGGNNNNKRIEQQQNQQEQKELPEFIKATLDQFQESGGKVENDCVICMDTITDPIMLSCGHTFCSECGNTAVETFKQCSICKRPAHKNEIIKLTMNNNSLGGGENNSPNSKNNNQEDKEEEQKPKGPDPILSLRIGGMKHWPFSVKTKRLSDLMLTFPHDENHIIVFSQFLQFLEFLDVRLKNDGHETYLYSGKQSASKRANILKDFQKPLREQHNINNNNNAAVKQEVKQEVDQEVIQQEVKQEVKQEVVQQEEVKQEVIVLDSPQQQRVNVIDGSGAAASHPNAINGTMNQNQNQQQQQQLPFKKRKILLATIQTCGIGVNITAATRCVLLDPTWNNSIAEQAISRCHRIGQTRPVHIYKFHVGDTVEDDIVALAKSKGEFEDVCLNKTPNNGNGGNAANGRGGVTLREMLNLFRIGRDGEKEKEKEKEKKKDEEEKKDENAETGEDASP